MRTRALAAIPLVLLLAACIHSDPVQTTFAPPYPERNGAGDPILAVFAGRIPCAITGCEMRKVELVLYGSEPAPTTYWLGQVGLGLGNDPLVQRGTWIGRRGVQQYPDALVYALDANADPSLQYFWRVSDEILLLLDPNMRPRAGTAAWGAMLSRNCAAYGPTTYPYDKRTKRFIAPMPGTADCSHPTARN
jgi:hypothetical protein